MGSKLEMEVKKLKSLKETVNRSKQLTNRIVNVLSSCDLHLAHVEESILPVYYQTESLQVQQKNLKQTLKVLDHVTVFYNTSKEVEATIQAGPSLYRHGKASLQEFLQALEKLKSALEYFQANNSECLEHNKVKNLSKEGLKTLNHEFKRLLFDHSEPVPLVTLLELVTPIDDAQLKTDLTGLQLPEKVLEQLQIMGNWLKDNSNEEYIDVYVAVRSNALLRAILNLKDHQRSSSGSSVHSAGSANSPILRAKFKHEASGARGSKFLQYLFDRKVKNILTRAASNYEYSVGRHRSGAVAELKDDAVNEQELVNFVMCVMVLQKLMQNEKKIMTSIFQMDLQPLSFENIIRDSLHLVAQDGENIAVRIKKNVNHNEFSSSLTLFPFLKYLQSMLPEYKNTVKNCSENTTTVFSPTYNILHSTAKKVLEDFIEKIHYDSSTQVPADGTVHELTSNTLVFLEQLFDFSVVIGEILAQKFEYSNILSLSLITQLLNASRQKDKYKIVFGVYIQKVLTDLRLTLCNKSKLYSDVYLRAIFLLNNIHQILKRVQESGLLTFVKLSKLDFETAYEKIINESKDVYLQSWNKLLCYISSPDDFGLTKAGSLKLKEKDKTVIKQKFLCFNREIEEIVRVQSHYSIADEDLRKKIIENNKKMIVPPYMIFYQKYTAIIFSKNSKKYIKYTPEEITSMIDKLFDVAA